MYHVCHSAFTTIQVSYFKSEDSKAPPLMHGHAYRTHLISPLHSAHAARQDRAPQRPPPPWRQPQETGQIQMSTCTSRRNLGSCVNVHTCGLTFPEGSMRVLGGTVGGLRGSASKLGPLSPSSWFPRAEERRRMYFPSGWTGHSVSGKVALPLTNQMP